MTARVIERRALGRPRVWETAAQTSGLSAPEPATRHRFPLVGVGAIIVALLVVIVSSSRRSGS
ncbi:hypothetical protein [Nocardia mangyaensis]|uniref:hypothetical protein n=1 Tax=Nocardia mangyaensis TaxID=2213200 RepID=UPI000AD61A11|nr:hypothetical protein [Nocardia mangyaensis]